MLAEEVDTLAEVTGTSLVPFGSVALAAWSGDAVRLEALLARHLDDVIRRREGSAVAMLSWAEAMFRNAQGRSDLALVAAQRAVALRQPLDAAGSWGLVELVEAAARAGDAALASSAVEELSDAIGLVDTNWALGVRSRARAIADTAGRAEDHHREAVERLQQTGLRMELARAQLLYGEWLRRARRTGDARVQLDAAHGTFADIGAAEFARRAARELRATGIAPRARTDAAPLDLTPQEEQIALLASKGLSNPEIAGRLFLSTRTIEYHLHKVFTKLSVTSRRQLTGALSTWSRVGAT
jgi:DNA-binding CsgD family transcriptional regulator